MQAAEVLPEREVFRIPKPNSHLLRKVSVGSTPGSAEVSLSRARKGALFQRVENQDLKAVRLDSWVGCGIGRKREKRNG